jgi:hypothetical protein
VGITHQGYHASLLGSAILVETEMNAAIDPRIVDVGRDRG